MSTLLGCHIVDILMRASNLGLLGRTAGRCLESTHVCVLNKLSTNLGAHVTLLNTGSSFASLKPAHFFHHCARIKAFKHNWQYSQSSTRSNSRTRVFHIKSRSIGFLTANRGTKRCFKAPHETRSSQHSTTSIRQPSCLPESSAAFQNTDRTIRWCHERKQILP